MTKRYEIKVRKLLERYYERYERQFYKGEYAVTEDLIDLERAIASADLTERQLKCLRLVYVEDLEQGEAGLRLGLAQNTVSFHLNAAIRKIAKYYDKSNVQQGEFTVWTN